MLFNYLELAESNLLDIKLLSPGSSDLILKHIDLMFAIIKNKNVVIDEYLIDKL